jgi:hypothetical protein
VEAEKETLGKRRQIVEEVEQDMEKPFMKQIVQKHDRSSECIHPFKSLTQDLQEEVIYTLSAEFESEFGERLDGMDEEWENILLEEDRLVRSESRREEILRDKRKRRLIGKDGRLKPRSENRTIPRLMRGSLLRFEVKADEVDWGYV